MGGTYVGGDDDGDDDDNVDDGTNVDDCVGGSGGIVIASDSENNALVPNKLNSSSKLYDDAFESFEMVSASFDEMSSPALLSHGAFVKIASVELDASARLTNVSIEMAVVMAAAAAAVATAVVVMTFLTTVIVLATVSDDSSNCVRAFFATYPDLCEPFDFCDSVNFDRLVAFAVLSSGTGDCDMLFVSC